MTTGNTNQASGGSTGATTAGCCGSSAQRRQSCCGPAKEESASRSACCGPVDEDAAKQLVREAYGKVGAGERKGCGCGTDAGKISANVGYGADEMGAVPEGANLGLGCGNPTAIAGLQAGQTVLDLGAGGGFDCFLAARKVSPDGKVIGVDMTPEMVARARRNARKGGYQNVEFRLGEIEALPVADASVDVVISNCVINLVPDKARVFREVARVLKPGGRMFVSDVVLLRPLPDWVLESAAAYTGCVAGAVSREEYLRLIAAAGLDDVEVLSQKDATESFVDPTDPEVNRLIAGHSVDDIRGLVASVNVTAKRIA